MMDDAVSAVAPGLYSNKCYSDNRYGTSDAGRIRDRRTDARPHRPRPAAGGVHRLPVPAAAEHPAAARTRVGEPADHRDTHGSVEIDGAGGGPPVEAPPPARSGRRGDGHRSGSARAEAVDPGVTRRQNAHPRV